MKFFSFILFFSSQFATTKEIVYLIRDNADEYNNQLFFKADLNNRRVIWSGCWEANMWMLTKRLLESVSNYELRTPSTKDRKKLLSELRHAKWIIDNTYSLQFSYNLNPQTEKWLLDKMVVTIFEPPVVQPRSWCDSFHNRVKRVFTWDDSYVARDPKKYFLIRYPFYSGAKNIDIIPFEQKKLCCAVNGNKHSTHSQSLYEKRKEDALIWDFNFSHDFDFYGSGFSSEVYKNSFKGSMPADRKIEGLRNYKFCLSYENMHNAYGWVSERMFNCLEAGCVPVYLGSVNIDKFVPRNCYIDRAQFESNEHLYIYLKNMSKQDYEQYIQNIKNYLASDQPNEFTYERFAEYVVAGLLT